MSELYNSGKFINPIFVSNINETDMLKHRNLVGWITLLSGVIGLVSYILVAGAINFNFEFFSDPSVIFTTEGVSRTMLKWSMITDVFGYYLLLLPVLFFIHEWLKGKSEWRNIFTFCGTSYIFAGALGASILAAAWPVLFDRFSGATPEQQEIIKHSFENLALIVVNGIWNLFDALMFGVWFIAIGFFIKSKHQVWGWFTIIVGLLSAIDFVANALEINSVAEIALNLYLLLAPIWAIGFGLALKQNKVMQNSI